MDVNEIKRCVFLGAGEGNTPSISSNDDSSLAVDAEGQMARFVTKPVLTYCT